MIMETHISLHVVYDRSGNILAVAIDDRSLSDHIPLPRPVPQRGQFAATLAVPPEAGGKDIRVIAETYVVKGRGEDVRLVLRSSALQKRTGAVRKSARGSNRKKPPIKRR